MNIDELTDPGPQDPRFFADLSDRIIGIGKDAGLRPPDAERVARSLKKTGKRYAKGISQGRVREFVKEAATLVAQKVMTAGTQGGPT